jgi:predicted RNA-binding protein YlxR (DUF448 family)
MAARNEAIADEAAGAIPGEAEAGAADDAEERGCSRRCIVTGTVQPKEGMIRFAVAPDSTVVPDLEETLPGRGLWVTAERPVLEKAIARNLFSKAARRAVRPPADLVSRLETLLERRCLDRIGLARRAGQALAGFEKVREALKAGRVGRASPPALLLEAADGAVDGCARLAALAPGIARIGLFNAGALGAALGRDHAVHAVIAQGRLAEGLARDAARLRGVRGNPVGTGPTGQGN